jgi:hypothetical protein
MEEALALAAFEEKSCSHLFVFIATEARTQTALRSVIASKGSFAKAVTFSEVEVISDELPFGVALVLKDEEVFEEGVVLARSIFGATQPQEEFALQVSLQGSKADNEQFLRFLFLMMRLPVPRRYHSERTLTTLTRDVRFATVLDIALSSNQAAVFKELAHRFVEHLLVRSQVSSSCTTLFAGPL